MTLADIRPFFFAALVALAVLSMVRSNYRQRGHGPASIPVRFEEQQKPRQVEVRRHVD